MSRMCRVILLVCSACLAASAPVAAQQLSISGTIDDGTGPVPDASITITDSDGVTREAKSDSTGKYRVDGLREGSHLISVVRDGYASTTRTAILSTQSLTTDFRLRVATFTTSVDVVGTIDGSLANSLNAQTKAGSRLDLTALETPATVTTLSNADIQLRGDPDVNAAVTRAVGITSTASIGAAGTTVAARGFGDTSVAFLYDGIRNLAEIGDVAWPYDPWTIERIEVLNGPASVLYGIGGIGGSLNIVPRRPSRNPEHAVRVSAGAQKTYKGAIDSTGPISKSVLYRVSVSQQASEGFLEDGTSKSTAVSGSIAFVPTDKVRLTVMHDWAYIKPMDNNGQLTINGAAVRALAKQNYGTSDMDVHHNENLTRVDLHWTPTPEVSVRNIASYIHGERLWHMGATALGYRPETNDVLRSYFGDWAQSQNQWGNQISLTWRHPLAGRRNTVVVGNAADRMDYTRIVTLWPGKFDIVPLFGPPKSGSYPTSGAEIGPAANHLVTRLSGFAEDRLQVAPRVSLIGGLRFDHQNFDRIDLVTPVRSQVSRTDNVFNYRAGTVLTVARNTNLYAQHSVATDGPDYLLCCGSADNVRNLKPTRGRQVEVGLKQSRSNGRLEWTVAGYRIVKTDLLIFDRTSSGEGRYIQAGAQSSRGVEATIAIDLGAGLQVGASGTVLKPVFDELVEAVDGQPVSRNGNRPPNVPWKSGNLLATWAFGRSWIAQGALRFVGERYIDTTNLSSLPAYTIVDATLRKSLSSKVSLDFRVTNLFDEFYPQSYTGNGLGGINWLIGAPRSAEVVLTAGF